MAVYKIFPTKDATIYSLFPNMNTGLDEIIEATETQISATNNSNPAASRFIIQFSESEIEDVLENKIGISSSAQLLNNNFGILGLKLENFIVLSILLMFFF
jgi:hypothetical protein